ncbi:Uncharacterised protein [uncultured archaeon]|nr:Uncharacterised protein [uncultured archaeon]
MVGIEKEVLSGVNISELKGVLISNFSDNFRNLPPELVDKIGSLILIFKAIGILFLVYLVFLIVKSILSIIEKRRIKKIYNIVSEMDKKLDILVKKKGKNK